MQACNISLTILSLNKHLNMFIIHANHQSIASSVGDTAVYKVKIHARAMQLAVRRLLWDQAPGTIFIVTMTGGQEDAQLQ